MGISERELREEYDDYVNSKAGLAYRCDPYHEWKFKRLGYGSY